MFWGMHLPQFFRLPLLTAICDISPVVNTSLYSQLLLSWGHPSPMFPRNLPHVPVWLCGLTFLSFKGTCYNKRAHFSPILTIILAEVVFPDLAAFISVGDGWDLIWCFQFISKLGKYYSSITKSVFSNWLFLHHLQFIGSLSALTCCFEYEIHSSLSTLRDGRHSFVWIRKFPQISFLRGSFFLFEAKGGWWGILIRSWLSHYPSFQLLWSPCSQVWINFSLIVTY